MTAKIRRWTLTYFVLYMALGGVGLTFLPDIVLEIFHANDSYSDIMPRAVGIFMMGIAYLVFNILNNEDWKYYSAIIFISLFEVILLFWLYSKAPELLFIVFNGIALVGLIPSLFVYFFLSDEPE